MSTLVTLGALLLLQAQQGTEPQSLAPPFVIFIIVGLIFVGVLAFALQAFRDIRR